MKSQPVSTKSHRVILIFSVMVIISCTVLIAADRPTSYAPVVVSEDFEFTLKRMKADKSMVMKRQMDLLNKRYDLGDLQAQGITMTRGKPIQERVRVNLPNGMSWDKLTSMTPEEIRKNNLFPRGFMPLPHPNHPEGGMVYLDRRDLETRWQGSQPV